MPSEVETCKEPIREVAKIWSSTCEFNLDGVMDFRNVNKRKQRITKYELKLKPLTDYIHTATWKKQSWEGIYHIKYKVGVQSRSHISSKDKQKPL